MSTTSLEITELVMCWGQFDRNEPETWLKSGSSTTVKDGQEI